MSTTSVDFGEIICNAVDTIVTSKLEGLQFDVTKICTIIDDSQRNQGIYKVSDGSVKFDAFSDVNIYRKNNSVLVNIPNNDYSMQKIIVGKYTQVNSEPFNYVSPLDTMIRITNNQVQTCESGSLLANEQKEDDIKGTFVKLFSSEDDYSGLGYTRLGIRADFKTLLGNTNVFDGNYGLKIYLTAQKSNKDKDETSQNVVYELSLSNNDMYGNPYAFENYFSQEKVFDISAIENIKKIEIYFYQAGNFIDDNDELIPWQYESDELASERMLDNLFVDGVNLFLGYDSSDFKDETLTLYTSNELGYWHINSEEENKKTINLRWIHKLNDNDYTLIEQLENNYGTFEIHWFRYDDGAEIVDKYAGMGWKEIEEGINSFTLDFIPNLAQQSEEIKVIGIYHPLDELENKEYGQVYFSNILKFNNLEDVPDAVTVNATTALSIKCEDGTDGNYFLYDQNGKLMNDGEGRQKARQLTALFNGAVIDSGLGVLNYLQWYIPTATEKEEVTENNSSMLHPVYDNNKVKIENNYSYKGTTYSVITLEPKDSGNGVLSFDEQGYYIKNFWTPMKSNNTIMCKLKMNGIIYTAEKELNFGRAGSNGTNLTLTLDFAFGYSNAIEVECDEKGNIIDSNHSIGIEAHLYDIKGNDLKFSSTEGCGITWGWYKENSLMNYNQNEIYPELCTVSLNESVQTIPSENYHIIKCSYMAPNGVTLEAYLPIPIKNKKYAYIEGAKEIIYNHQSEPKYYSDAYKLFDIDQKEIIANWELKTTNELYPPSLKGIYVGNKSYVGMSAAPFYIKNENDQVCVISKVNENIVWSQPILIMQSQYDFALLNDWDGKLALDEGNGTIMSTMLGAGKKDSQNKFSGVLIGDIQGGSGLNDTSSLTGVYGIDKGVVSYALKEDGTATLGRKGAGQIQIDGNNATIKSAGYLEGGPGMSIDMNDGIIDIKGKSGGEVLIQPQNSYFQIKSTTNQQLIKISSGDYFLQSNNYTEGGTYGTKINLLDGQMDIKSPYGKMSFANGANDSPFLTISVPNNDIATTGVDYGIDLLHVSVDDYYLQSKGFITQSIAQINGYNTYLERNGTTIVAISPEGDIYNVSSGALSGKKTFSEQTIEVITGLDDDGKPIYKNEIVSAEKVKDAYIATLIPRYVETAKVPSGFKLDLKNGNITGYDIYLKGVNRQNANKSFIFDSSNRDYPIQVGKNFRVSWDGDLFCNNIQSLNNDNRNQYAISIGNNFYVTKNGSAGGGTYQGNVSGYSGGVAGYSGKPLSLANGSTVYVLGK